MNYPILCEDCACDLGRWTPRADETPTESDIFRATKQGYLCEACAELRAQGQQSDDTA